MTFDDENYLQLCNQTAWERLSDNQNRHWPTTTRSHQQRDHKK